MWHRWRYELRLVGIGTYLAPVGVIAIYGGFSLLVYRSDRANGMAAPLATFLAGRGLLALLENGLPLALGLLAASAMQRDPLIELQASAMSPYSHTLARRLGIVLLCGFLAALITSATVAATGFWIVPLDFALGQLVWMTPLVCFAMLGALLSLLLRSRAASGTILGLLWLVQFLFKDQFLANQSWRRLYLFLTEQIILGISRANVALWYATWLQNRLILLGIAMLLMALIAWVASRTEYLLGAHA